MAKKQTVQKTEGKVDEVEQVEESIQETVVIELSQVNDEENTNKNTITQDDETDFNPTGQAEDCNLGKNDETVQIPEFASSLLKLYNTYQKLYIDSKGGVFVQPHDDATEYANPYFIQ